MVDVFVHGVDTRGGLQGIAEFIPTEVKKKWCSDEFAAGDPPFHGAIARAGLPKGFQQAPASGARIE